MKQITFTEGPWKVTSDEDPGCISIQSTKSNTLGCIVYNSMAGLPGIYEPEHPEMSEEGELIAKANARLISAAPELLATLEIARDHLEGADQEDGVDYIEDLKTIRNAIAKATGWRRD